MKWHNESWVKLYIRRTAEWDDMSVMARGIGNELLKYAKNDGSLCRTKGREPAMAVALVLKPKPDELEAVVSAAAELLEDGYLVVDGGFVWIKNYEDAQERRSPSAVKQQRYRDRKEAESQEPTGNTSGNTRYAALPGDDPRRDETRRDSIPTGAPDGAAPIPVQAPLSLVPPEPKPRRRADKPPNESYQLVEFYEQRWVSRFKPEDGNAPPRPDAMFGHAKKLIADNGLEIAFKYVAQFIADDDPFISKRGHVFVDIASRIPAYKKAANVPAPRGSLPLSTSVDPETRKNMKW